MPSFPAAVCGAGGRRRARRAQAALDCWPGFLSPGDIFNGHVFVSDLAAMKKADDGIPQTVAPVEEVQLYVRDATGKRVDVSFRDLIEQAMGKPVTRADLHISASRDGELFLTSRQDGMIRMLVPDSGGVSAN